LSDRQERVPADRIPVAVRPSRRFAAAFYFGQQTAGRATTKLDSAAIA
jgi:hypothetical protein